jgi:hypothetical protein
MLSLMEEVQLKMGMLGATWYVKELPLKHVEVQIDWMCINSSLRELPEQQRSQLQQLLAQQQLQSFLPKPRPQLWSTL